MKKRVYTFGIAITAFVSLIAQNEIDALRYSYLFHGGTARYNAMGGAFGALGADISVASTNPAGIGLFRKSELTFTPTFLSSGTESNFMGNSIDDNKYNFHFQNTGFVLAGENDYGTNWKGFGMAIGFNRINTFHNRVLIQGDNNSSSLLDVYLNDANSSGNIDNLNEFGSLLFFNTYLLDTIANGSYFSVIPYYGETQTKSIETRGALGEAFFSFGANYSDKLYIGGTIGMPRIRYTEETVHSESLENDTLFGFKQFDYATDLETSGNGTNFKFGMIYRPADWLRIGGAVHTPTYFRMTDEWQYRVNAKFQNISFNDASPNGNYNYTLTTPARAIGSIAFIYKKYGVVNAEYEFVDYSTARLRASSYKYFEENKNIRGKYTSAGNVRVGAEMKLDPIALRAGFAYYGSPYKNGINDASRMSYSGGIGFREGNFFIDFAYVLSTSSEKYYLYNPDLIEASVNKNTSSLFSMTLGFKY